MPGGASCTTTAARRPETPARVAGGSVEPRARPRRGEQLEPRAAAAAAGHALGDPAAGLLRLRSPDRREAVHVELDGGGVEPRERVRALPPGPAAREDRVALREHDLPRQRML